MLPDARRKKPQEEEEHPVTELYDIDWRETSFVPAGDNPEARLVFWKADPSSASELTDEEIEQVFDEVEKTERRSGGMTTQTFTKRADEGRSGMTEVDTLAQQKIAAEPERFAKISDPRTRRAAARSEVRSERPDLWDQPSAEHAVPQEATGVPVVKGADILAEVDRDIERLLSDPRVLEVPEHSRMAKARLLAWEKPGRKERYHKAVTS